MKTNENKGFGLIGIRVELTWIEVMAISELANELNNYQPYGHPVGSKAVEKAINFLCKLHMSQIEGDIKKAEEDLFSAPKIDAPMPLMSDDDLKNECDLNALENETHQ